MHVAQREFTDEIVERIGQVVRETAELTRSALSRLVCGWLGWKDAAGRAKESSCRALLVKLERRGLIELPPARPVSFEAGKDSIARVEETWPQLKTTLQRLGVVELVVVNGDRAHSRIWRAMMQQHHPLGDGPLCGAQLRYLIRSEQGWLGGLSFSSAAWRLGVRDEWIGWSEATRGARLSRIVLNSRFLILPSVQVPHLASHVLGLATRRLAADWQQRYDDKPVQVETFVDSSRYRGTCYRAANWVELGMTEGRGRQERARQEQVARKHVFVYPLQRNWRQILTAPLELPRLLPTKRMRAPVDWALCRARHRAHYAECPGMPSNRPRAYAFGRWPWAGSMAARHSPQAYRFFRKASNAASGLKAGGADPAGVVLASTLRFSSRSALR